ncbi:Type I transmembrane sorting receptor [Sticta canariensis]|nr:Type I transmembrane sorting receptor [Sticta canariensis]
MLSFKSSIKAAILVLSVLASSIDGQDCKKSFTLHQIESTVSVKSRPAAPLSTYHEYKRRAPENVKSAAAVDHGTVIASTSDFDKVYLTPITIGGQTLNLLIDTGSDFFVGDIVVNNQTIGVAKEVTSNFLQTDVLEGILGLSFNQDSMGIFKYTPFWDNIKSTLSAPLFTADLKKGKPGSYDFGFIDDSKYTGNITYVSVDTSQGFWTFTIKGYAIGGEILNPITVNVIADTGTTLILLPEQMVKAYCAGVPIAFYNSTEAKYSFPCRTTLPSITFDIGNYNAVVPGHFMNFRPRLDDDNTCYGGIQPAFNPQDFILGDIFLKSQFIVFDAGNEPRLGFAAKPL